MTGLLRAETRKLLTVRGTYGLLLLGVALPVLLVGLEDGDAARAGIPLWVQNTWFVTTRLTALLVVVLGVRAFTDEHRFGTLTPTLLVVRSRTSLVTAKAVVLAAAGAAVTLLSQLAFLATARVVAATRDLPFDVTSADVAAGGRAVAAGALYAVVGVAVGALVRQATAAAVGAAVWFVFLEDVLRSQVGDSVAFPVHAGLVLLDRTFLSAQDTAPYEGALALAAWALVGGAAAALALRRRDVH